MARVEEGTPLSNLHRVAVLASGRAGPCTLSEKPSFRAKKGLPGLPDSTEQRPARGRNVAADVGRPEDTTEEPSPRC